MAQIRNKIDIEEAINEDNITRKRLPRFFDENDEMKFLHGISLSILVHFVGSILFVVLVAIEGFIMPHLPKPELPNRDIEFKLVQAPSKPPINKNTRIRSDRDSQAGGKHDPKKAISEPAPKPAPKAKAPAKVAKNEPKQQPKQQKPQPKQQQKSQPKQPVQQPKVAQQPKKPSPINAPSAVKPAIKPTSKPQGVAAPTAPKIASAPKSPFQVTAPPSKAPVGTTYRPAGTPAAGGGSSTGKGSSAPAPKFSSTGVSGGSKGGSGSAGGTKYASRGTGGYGTGGNPSPGNPNGTPGIDARKEPNWGPYMRDLEQRIKRNWTPPKGDSTRRVVITFEIGRDGRLLSHKITKSSGVPLADRAAMSAIELTAPFRPLPPEFKGQSVPIEFTFDYNVLNSVLR